MSVFWCVHCGKMIDKKPDADGLWTGVWVHYASQNMWCQPQTAEPRPSVLEEEDEGQSSARHAAR